MGRTFATTSGKGGVGKSSIAVGLAMAFCDLGQTVLLVDMDEGLRNLDIALGIDSTAVFDLSDAVRADDIKSTAYGCHIKGLSLIPAAMEAGQISDSDFSLFAKKSKALFDVVIFDFPAGLDFSRYSLLPKNTLFITVTNADPVSIRAAAAVSKALENQNLYSRLLINKFNLKTHKRWGVQGIDGIIDTTSLRLLGIVPESKEISHLSVTHNINKHSKAYKALWRVAERLLDKETSLPELKKI